MERVQMLADKQKKLFKVLHGISWLILIIRTHAGIVSFCLNHKHKQDQMHSFISIFLLLYFHVFC